MDPARIELVQGTPPWVADEIKCLRYSRYWLFSCLPTRVRALMGSMVSKFVVHDVSIIVWLLAAIATLWFRSWRLLATVSINLLVCILIAAVFRARVPRAYDAALHPRGRVSPNGLPCVELWLAVVMAAEAARLSQRADVTASAILIVVLIVVTRVYGATHFPHYLALSAAGGVLGAVGAEWAAAAMGGGGEGARAGPGSAFRGRSKPMPRGWELAGCAMLVLALLAVWGYYVENGGWRGAGASRSEHLRVLGSIMAEEDATVSEDEVMAVLERAVEELERDREGEAHDGADAGSPLEGLKDRIRELIAVRQAGKRRRKKQRRRQRQRQHGADDYKNEDEEHEVKGDQEEEEGVRREVLAQAMAAARELKEASRGRGRGMGGRTGAGAGWYHEQRTRGVGRIDSFGHLMRTLKLRAEVRAEVARASRLGARERSAWRRRAALADGGSHGFAGVSLAAGTAAEVRAAARGDVYPGLARAWVLLTGGDGREVRAVRRAEERLEARRSAMLSQEQEVLRGRVDAARATAAGVEAGLRAARAAAAESQSTGGFRGLVRMLGLSSRAAEEIVQESGDGGAAEGGHSGGGRSTMRSPMGAARRGSGLGGGPRSVFDESDALDMEGVPVGRGAWRGAGAAGGGWAPMPWEEVGVEYDEDAGAHMGGSVGTRRYRVGLSAEGHGRSEGPEGHMHIATTEEEVAGRRGGGRVGLMVSRAPTMVRDDDAGALHGSASQRHPMPWDIGYE